jgi:putative oxidoreductase
MQHYLSVIGPYVGLAARIIVGGYFVYAAVPKIVEPLAFATSIAAYGLVPSVLVNGMALTLPWLELLCAIGLMVGWRVRLNAISCSAMLAMFTAAVAYAVIAGLKIDCGCFGSSGGEEVSWTKVGKNLVMLAGLLYLVWRPSTPLSFDGRVQGAQ